MALRHRWTASAVAISIVALIGLWAWHHLAPPPIANLPPKNLTIVAFGDSLTAGSGAPAGKDYPAQLAQMLGRPVINGGRSGDTTADALSRLPRDVLPLDPGIVIVILGGNDLLRGLSANVAEKNLDLLIDTLQRHGAVVVLGEIRAPGPTPDFGSLYRRLARRHGALLVPNLLAGILTNPALKSDPIHPNEKGYRIMAERIAQALEPLLRESR